MDINLHVVEREKKEDTIKYPILAKWKNAEAVVLFTSNNSGILVSDPEAINWVGDLATDGILELDVYTEEWEILSSGSSVTFLQE